jgi:O-antigen/teichoic acid export membrane protein
MLPLLLVPYLNCAFGLAGNSLVYSGRSGLNLANNLGVAAANTLLNWLLIPRWGLLGAAAATCVASAGVAALQVIQLRAYEGIRWQWRESLLPHAAMALAAAAIAVCGDPAHLGTPGLRALLAGGVLLGFSALMIAFRHPDYMAVLRRTAG